MCGRIKFCQGPGAMGSLLVGIFISTTILENNLAMSNELKDTITFNPAIPLRCIFFRQLLLYVQRNMNTNI